MDWKIMNNSTLKFDERLLRLITDNVDDLIAVHDLDGKQLYNSRSYEKIFGHLNTLQRSDPFENVHPDDRERIRQVFTETVRTGIGKRAEYRFRLEDGTIRHIE